MSDNPLGKPSRYADEYAPKLLYAVDRATSRTALDLGEPLPFHGADVWNAWDLTWLSEDGRPVVATMSFAVPADSSHIVESKSLKLYLNSFAMSRYPSHKDVARLITADLARIVGTEVPVDIRPAAKRSTGRITKMPGRCVDNESVTCDRYTIDAGLLQTSGNAVSESLHSHSLRNLCPVTGQPDMGSVLITYHGPLIEPDSLLRYLTSFRRHSDFHEACVERIFRDLKQQCRCEQLSVYARYNRRGGIDINPFRSDFEAQPAPMRLWRQ